MTSWFASNSSAIPEWKVFITSFEELKVKESIKMQKIQPNIEIQQFCSIRNIQLFLNNITLMLNQIKTYNNEMTDFVRNHLPLFIKQSIRLVLQIPAQNQTQQRKNKFPLQGLQFIEGIMYLPNIFNINFLKQEIYIFYCKCLMYYFKQNLQQIKSKQNVQEYQNSLYKNYFLRLFEVPYTVSECQTRIGVNYSSINMSVASSITQKKQSFLQYLISFMQKNPIYTELVIGSIQNQSLSACLSKIIMTNGMYNYPYTLKQFILKKMLQVKKKYIQLLSNLMNNKYNQDQLNFMNFQKQQMELKIQNILQLQFNIINRSANIYDGIKLFEFVSNLQNVKDIIYLSSVNVVWTNRNPQNKPLVPSFVEEHLSQVLLAIVHKDTTLYKSSSPTIQLQPKISLKDINLSIQPLLLSLKQLFSSKLPKPQIKHLNLVKILYVMILNRQKYDIVDSIIIKHNILCMLVQMCKKYYQNDILVNSILQIFKSIFKSQLNPLIITSNNINYQEVKSKNDIIEEKITAQAFKAADLILATIKTMKSHKDPLFGQFFKLAKVVKQFSRNYFSSIESSNLDMSCNGSIRMESSSNFNNILQPVYKNDFIKAKSKEWQDFYISNFLQLQNNYLRDLGKFDQFQKLSPPNETKFSVVKFCDKKQVTQSQMIHDKGQVQATIKNSIQILSLKKQQEDSLITKIDSNSTKNLENQLYFKKDKFKKQQAESKVLKQQLQTSNIYSATKEQIQITSEPIKIQFKRKTKNLDSESDSTNENENQQNPKQNEESLAQNAQNSFKNFMKKKINQITIQNRQNETKRKSKTPTKFKTSQSKTPPKMKKWGNINQPIVPPSQQVNTTSIKNPTKQSQKINFQGQNSKSNANIHTHNSKQKDQNPNIKCNLQKIRERIIQNKPLPIKILMVGNKKPKVYKERLIDPTQRDSRLFQWIRA